MARTKAELAAFRNPFEAAAASTSRLALHYSDGSPRCRYEQRDGSLGIIDQSALALYGLQGVYDGPRHRNAKLSAAIGRWIQLAAEHEPGQVARVDAYEDLAQDQLGTVRTAMLWSPEMPEGPLDTAGRRIGVSVQTIFDSRERVMQGATLEIVRSRLSRGEESTESVHAVTYNREDLAALASGNVETLDSSRLAAAVVPLVVECHTILSGMAGRYGMTVSRMP